METTQTDWRELTSFTPRQQAATEAMYTHRYILYGGARGGGKSRWLRWVLVEFLIDLFLERGIRGVRVMLACETYPDLRDRQITKFDIEFPAWLGSLKDTKENGLSFTLSDELGGGVIALRNLDDPSKYQSAEFAAIGVDELTKIPKETFDILRGSLRWPNVNHTVFIGATNPGGIGHAWVKGLWIDRAFPPELAARAAEFVFIQSLPADNPYLPQSYWDELNSLPPTLRKAWVEGDWNVFSGMAFPGWSAAHVVERFDIPAYWPRVCGIDWGYAKPFCCLWLAKDPDSGRHFIYRELYQAGLTDQQQARLIKEYTRDEPVSFYFADPSMWQKKTQQIITSTADEYMKEGIPLTAADNDRLSGKRKVDRFLMPLPDGRPGLQVVAGCKNLLRTFPLLAYDEHQPEDIDTEQEDHAYDALRYVLTQITGKQKQQPSQANPWMKKRSYAH